MFKTVHKKVIKILFSVFIITLLLVGCRKPVDKEKPITEVPTYLITIDEKGVGFNFTTDITKKIKQGTTISFSIDTMPLGKVVSRISIGSIDLIPQSGIYQFVVTKDTHIRVHLVDIDQTRQVFYNVLGGSNHLDNPQFFEIDSGLIPLKPARKQGYEFKGWIYEDEYIESIDTALAKDLRITADFSPIQYDVTYKLNGGINHLDNPLSFNVEDSPKTLYNPTKAGHTFGGWYDDSGVQYFEILPKTAKNITLIAKFDPIQYNIYYTYNGGEVVDNPKTFTSSQREIELIPTRKQGYTFMGWYENDTKVEALSLNRSGHINLEARFAVEVYTITYHLVGENHPQNPTSYHIESENIELLNPTRECFRFIGWFDSNNEKLEVIQKGSQGQIVLTAQYELINYTITYNTKGTHNNPETYNITTPDITLLEPSLPGYQFLGWYSGTDKFETILSGSVGHLVLEAQFELINYQLSFDHEFEPISFTVEQQLSLPTPSKKGHSFVGWYDDDNQLVTLIEKGTTKDVRLKARFQPITYHITYIVDGDIKDLNPKTYTIIDEIHLPIPVKVGFKFMGWFDSNDFINEVSKIPVGETGQKTLYAKFEKESFAIYYYLDEDLYIAEAHAYGAAIYLKPEPTKVGYQFSGWLIDGYEDFPSFMPADDIEVSGSFTSITYQITYHDEGLENNNPTTYTIADTFELLPIEKVGYTFIGWFTNNDEPVTKVSLGSTGNIELSARFSINTYTLTINVDGAIENRVYQFNQEIEAITIPEKPGYLSLGFDISLTHMPAHDLEINALYEAITYSITYEGLLDETHQNPNQYTVIDLPIVLKDPTQRAGYTFLGWYEGETKILEISTNTYRDITLEAKYVLNKHLITFSSNVIVTRAIDHLEIHSGDLIDYNTEVILTITYDEVTHTFGSLIINGVSIPLTDTSSPITYTLTIQADTNILVNVSLEGYYLVSFDSQGGTTIEALTVVEGGMVEAPTPPTKTGYSFVGWYKDLSYTELETFENPVTSSYTLYAKWQIESYSIKFIHEDGSLIETQTVEYNQLPAVPNTPTKDAENGYEYTFDGWDKEVVKAVADTTYQATFKATPIVYTMTYEGIEGATHSNVETYTIEQEILLSDATKVGYQFLGWFTEALEGEKVESISLGLTGNLTLYARFSEIEPETYIIEFVNEGVIISTQNVLEGNMPTIPADPEKPMTETQTFTFSGWSPAVDVATQDITYIATYTASPRAYTIKYLNLPDGADNSSNPKTYTKPRRNIRLNAPVLPVGYTFIGWLENDQPIEMIAINSTGDKVITANIQTNNYTITYNVGNGINHPNNPTQYMEGHTGIMLLEATAPEGYTFMGWFDGSETISEITIGRTGNIQLTAQYQIINYTITYILDGGINHDSNRETYTINTEAFQVYPATKAGHTFIGWQLENGEMLENSVIDKEMIGDLTLTAIYSIKTYTINYFLKGGVNAPGNVNSYTYLSDDIILQDATKAGYQFSGWYYNNQKIEVITKGSMINYELVAQYTPIHYTITYILDGGINAPSNPNTYTVVNGALLAYPTKEGYSFIGWRDQDDNLVPQIYPGTIGNITLTAHYVEAAQGVYINIINPKDAVIEVTNAVNIYQPIPEGTTVEFRLTAPDHYQIGSVVYANETLIPINGVYTIVVNQTANLQINVELMKVDDPSLIDFNYDLKGNAHTLAEGQINLINSHLRTSGGYIAAGDSIVKTRANIWTYGAYFTATSKAYLANKTQDNKTRLLNAINELDWYRATNRSDNHLVYASKGGDEIPAFFDDNIWIVIGFLQAYEGLGTADYLTNAKRVMEWIYTGWDTVSVKPGGIYWREWNPQNTPLETLQRNTCINGPAAWASAWLYQITEDQRYLTWAERIYAWTKENLLNHNDKLYSDNINGLGEYQYWQFTYNTGTMMSAAAYLFEITGNLQYKQDYLDLVGGTQNPNLNDHFLIKFGVSPGEADSRKYTMQKPIENGDFYKDNPWFRVYLFQGFLDGMKRIDINMGHYLERAKNGIYHANTNVRDSRGFIADDWLDLNNNEAVPTGKISTLNKAGNAENFATFALYEQYLQSVLDQQQASHDIKQTLASKKNYGLDLYAYLDKLPTLDLMTQTEQTSSYSRNGNNVDGFGMGGNVSGEVVEDRNNRNLLELHQPGVVTRIWFTTWESTIPKLKIYIDNTLTYDLDLNTMTNGSTQPFVKDLVFDQLESSGGYVSMSPLVFQSSIKIIGSGSFYYNIDYQKYPAGTPLVKDNYDVMLPEARRILNNVGSDPKITDNDNIISRTFNIPKNHSQTIYQDEQKLTMTALELKIPGLVVREFDRTQITDAGYKISSIGDFNFRLNVSASEDNTLIFRGLAQDKQTKAELYIDGVRFGDVVFRARRIDGFEWKDNLYFMDETIILPKSLIGSKTNIQIRLNVQTNDFHIYRAKTMHQNTLIDEINFGNGTSENNHQFSRSILGFTQVNMTLEYDPNTLFSNETWQSIYQDEDFINNVWIEIKYLNPELTAIKAPLSSFFGFGEYGVFKTLGLMVGIRADGWMYFYYPMPYSKGIRIRIENLTNRDINHLQTKISTEYNLHEEGKYYRFMGEYRHIDKLTEGIPLTLLEKTGSGYVVGVTHSMKDVYNGAHTRFYLEGDAQIYIDGSLGHSNHGTGIEDFYSGAWYFREGVKNNPLFGQTNHNYRNNYDRTVMTRTLITDAIYFRSSINFKMEHGGWNSQPNASSASMVYYYHQSTPKLIKTDELILGNQNSELVHGYQVSGNKQVISTENHTYEGYYQNTNAINRVSHQIDNSSTFNVTIQPNNDGVILRREYIMAPLGQRANVYVDGQLVGVWQSAQRNSYNHFVSQTDFIIPKTFTNNKQIIQIKIEVLSGESNQVWTESIYQIFSINNLV